MKPRPQCIRCVVNVRFREILGMDSSEDVKFRAGVRLLGIAFEEFNRGDELTYIATRIYHKLIKEFHEVKKYYERVKDRDIREALRILPSLEKLILKHAGYESFLLAVKASLVGNLFDTGVMEHTPPPTASLLDAIRGARLAIDHTREFYELVRKGGKTILWLFDNAGEAIFDIPLINLLRSLGNRVIGVAKEEPGFQNDLTIGDALKAGLDKYLDSLVSTGYPGSTIHLDKVGPEMKKLISRSDIIVAKGMSHWEYLSEIDLGRPVYHLLVAKCSVIAEALGVKRGSYIALLRMPRQSLPRPT
ncbi:MAG: ARMT1-like domain-containing protein [Pyrodictiaceae archaeon]